MPGFTIDTRSENSDESGKPHVELFYTDGDPVSLIQKTAIEMIETYQTDLYNITEEPGKIEAHQIQCTPTTIAFDDGYEIQRWETPTHADDIRDVLDSW